MQALDQEQALAVARKESLVDRYQSERRLDRRVPISVSQNTILRRKGLVQKKGKVLDLLSACPRGLARRGSQRPRSTGWKTLPSR